MSMADTVYIQWWRRVDDVPGTSDYPGLGE